MQSDEIVQQHRDLIDAWCDRHEYGALAAVLPAWIANFGMTDDWFMLHAALKHAYAACRQLPENEREILKDIYVAIEVALQSR